jgi:hypothetical protein
LAKNNPKDFFREASLIQKQQEILQREKSQSHLLEQIFCSFYFNQVILLEQYKQENTYFK